MGTKIIHDLEDPTTKLGKSYHRLECIEVDVKAVMQKVGVTSELANQANDIFKRSPESLDVLTDEEHQIIQDYWIKKKQCISELVKLGYTYQELFS